MSDIRTTIVVNFGDDTSSELVVVELDESRNLDSDGNTVTQFSPGDEVYFLVHHHHSLRIDSIETTSGDVVYEGTNIHTREQDQTFFPSFDSEVELTYIPSGGVSAVWYGNSSPLTINGRTVTATNTPCIGKLSYSLHLLIGLVFVFSQPIDHGGWSAAKGGVWTLVIVEGHPFADARLCLRAGFPSMQVDAFVFQAAPETLDKDVVEEPALAVH